VRHQSGVAELEGTRERYADLGVEAEVVPFIDDMAEAYGWADLVVCRAGALTVSELAAAGLGAVLVPFPHAVDDHQTANGRVLADAGAARLVPESVLDAAGLATLLEGLLENRPATLAMAEAARSRAAPDAAAAVADACIALMEGGRGGRS
jgi:UDP-N-acetylglucosamine--N-acetylmuramyl-(pentapeptide) pyrophosphoryl-undecaprenol N-acetylglucosamine transferase